MPRRKGVFALYRSGIQVHVHTGILGIKGCIDGFLKSVIGKEVVDVVIQENELAVTGMREKQSTLSA